MLFLKIPNIKFIQTNTDGTSVYIKHEDIQTAKDICKEWENNWDLKLDLVDYKTMIMRDVNNFLAVPVATDISSFDVENKEHITKWVKMKGFFEIEKDWHKNHSMKIVQKALANYFIKQIPVEKTIKEHTNIFDFFKMCKAKSDFKIEYWTNVKTKRQLRQLLPYEYDFGKGKLTEIDYVEVVYEKKITPMGRITRYLISNKGGQLMKIMPPIKTVKDTETEKFKKTHPNQTNMFDFIEDVLVIPDRESNIESGYLTTIHNRLTSTDIKDFDINYDYYINECKKVINAIENNESFEINESQLEFNYE